MSPRLDQRSDSTELRALSSSQNVLNRADGSARFSFGESSVIVSVCGPMDVSLRDEKLDEATVEVVVRPATGYAQTPEKLLEDTLRSTFEPIILSGMMPRTLIEIVVQIEKDDGSILSAAVNGIGLALLDAGLPMKYMPASVTCMVDKSTDEIMVDPTAQELENAASCHIFAFDSTSTKSHVLLSNSIGQFSEQQYFACHDLCVKAVDKIQGFLRVSIESKKDKEYQQVISSHMTTTSRRPATQPRPTKASALRTSSTTGPSSSAATKKADAPASSSAAARKPATTSTTSSKSGSKAQASEGVRAFMSAQRSRLNKNNDQQQQSNNDDTVKPRSGNVMTGAQRYTDHHAQDASSGTPNTSNLKSVIQQAKSSGRLDLSHRHLETIPEQILKMYHVDPNSIVVDFSSSGGDAWYDAVELTKFVAAFNEITHMDQRMGTEFGALTLLDFRNNRLQDLPPTLNQLRLLTTLHLPYNQFQAIPEVVFELTELRELVMAHNEITSLPDGIANLPRLEIIDLNHNRIGPHLPSGMESLTTLRKLHMDHNQLVSLPPTLMVHWQKLADLSMAHNRLTWFLADGMDPDDQCSLPSLVRLDLRHNNLRHLTPGLRLPKLKELLLADNSLTTAIDGGDDSTMTTNYSFLQHCENLLTLDVGSNQWTEIPPIIFDLTQLQRLDIGGNQLRGLPSDLGLLPNLITLTWQGNPFRSVPRNISMTELIESLRAAKVSQQETATSPRETMIPAKGDSPPSPLSPSDPVSSSRITSEQQQHRSEPVAITTRTLDFSGQKLSDFPESLVSSHSGVQTLRLNNNTLTTFSMTICARFSTTLVNLSLEQNKLSSFSLTLPSTITFASLKTLNLSNNRLSQLSHEPAATATNFPALAELDVTNNSLTDLPTGLSTQILPALRTLRCNSNRLCALDPESVVNVEVLDIGNNDIAVLPPALGLNSSLRELIAYGNRFRVPQPSLLAQGTPAVMAFLKRRAGVATSV